MCISAAKICCAELFRRFLSWASWAALFVSSQFLDQLHGVLLIEVWIFSAHNFGAVLLRDKPAILSKCRSNQRADVIIGRQLRRFAITRIHFCFGQPSPK